MFKNLLAVSSPMIDAAKKVRHALMALLIGVACVAVSSSARAAPTDLNFDGKSDLFFRSSAGEVVGWLMNGASVTSGLSLLPPGGWSITHAADLNGDGKADLVLSHTDGRIVVWLMNGLTVTSSVTLLGAGSGWAVSHAADFSGDGKADLLLRHADGRIFMWTMNGTAITGAATLLGAGSGWAASNSTDFNGDGKADILLKHTDGRIFMWLMNGLNIAGSATLIGAGSGWSATHTGDFNGDGRGDILLAHTDGSVFMWIMNGTAVTSGALLLPAASGWSVTQTADFNGDGQSDILLRHTDGRIVGWLVSGTTITSGAVLLSANPGWLASNTGDFNGDGKADILLRNSDGTMVVWILDGLAITTGALVLAPGPWSANKSSTDWAKSAGPPSKADAARLLSQATFGATLPEINRVFSLGASAYLDEQFAIPATSHLSTVRNDPNYPLAPYAVMMPSIWKQYFESNDQLRQRVVNALSQILVISQQNNTIGDQPCGTAGYLDMLGRNAFGNFRNILKEMTLSPAMGEYLDMKQSAKADSVLGSMANENYARELLQLFSIGTVMLNQDGSTQFSAGKPVQSYTETTVQEFARALTGWTFAGQDQTLSYRWLYPDVPYPADTSKPGQAEKACVAWSSPMQPWKGAKYKSSDDKREITGQPHDSGAKALLVYPGSASRKQNLPANQTPEQDLDDVIENVFYHPNVGPFISEQLIQRLVTSNPSGAYVARVAAVFNDNGAGVRGDMRAVVKAILLDVEARLPASAQPSAYGKLREPVMRFTQLHRAFGAKMQNGYYNIYDLGGSDSLGQSPVRAPSVFNFYHPDFAPSGVLSNAGLVGPEFEITNSATISGFMDFSKYGIINGFGQYESDKTKWIKPDYTAYIAQASTPAAMVDSLDLILLSGAMSSQFKAQLIDVATKLTDSNAVTQSTERFNTVLWLILNSPEYSIQK
jgi:uncharacterized protein (DUF1800 family)